MLYTALVLHSLRLFKLETEGQTIKTKLNCKVEKTQIKIFHLSWVSLSSFEKPNPE